MPVAIIDWRTSLYKHAKWFKLRESTRLGPRCSYCTKACRCCLLPWFDTWCLVCLVSTHYEYGNVSGWYFLRWNCILNFTIFSHRKSGTKDLVMDAGMLNHGILISFSYELCDRSSFLSLDMVSVLLCVIEAALIFLRLAAGISAWNDSLSFHHFNRVISLLGPVVSRETGRIMRTQTPF